MFDIKRILTLCSIFKRLLHSNKPAPKESNIFVIRIVVITIFIIVTGLVSLFNGITTFMGNLKPKPSWLKDSCGAI